MKKIVVVGLATLMMVGCSSTYQQQGAGIGAVTGAIIGNQVGGGAGQAVATVLGAAIGAEVGSNVGAHMDEPRTATIVHHTITYSNRPDYSACYEFDSRVEITACRKGADRAFADAQRKLKKQAYKAGYNSNN